MRSGFFQRKKEKGRIESDKTRRIAEMKKSRKEELGIKDVKLRHVPRRDERDL
jgi:hypothetical protein